MAGGSKQGKQQKLPLGKRIAFNLIALLLTLAIAFAVGEGFLRIQGNYYTYSEQTSGKYLSYYGEQRPSQVFVWPSYHDIVLDHGEFRYEHHFNSLGVREKEAGELFHDSVDVKVLALGDSYVEGVGAPYDSSWVRLFEDEVHRHCPGKQVAVYNAGVSGSDAVYAYSFLKEYYDTLQPDVCLVTINPSDIQDILFRGGFERFQPDGSAQFREGPWWEGLYEHLHTVRFVVHNRGYTTELVKPQLRDSLSLQAKNIIAESMDSIRNFCDQKNLDCHIFLQPYPDNIISEKVGFKENKWNHYFQPLAQQLITSDTHIHNLMPPLMEVYKDKKVEDYKWTIDGHFNSAGYQVMGQVVFDMLKEEPWLDCRNDTTELNAETAENP